MSDWRTTGICPTCGRRAITVGRCIECGWHSQEAADRAFETALEQRDKRALTAEVKRRLDVATYGTGISFKCGDGHPVCYRTTSGGDHGLKAAYAAEALIAYADEIGLVLR